MSQEAILAAVSGLAKKAALIYVLLDWKWTGGGDDFLAETQILEKLLNLYHRLKDSSDLVNSIEDNGLEVCRFHDDNKLIHYVFQIKVKEEVKMFNGI